MIITVSNTSKESIYIYFCYSWIIPYNTAGAKAKEYDKTGRTVNVISNNLKS